MELFATYNNTLYATDGHLNKIADIKANGLSIDYIIKNIISYIETETNGGIIIEMLYPNEFGIQDKYNSKFVGFGGRFKGRIKQENSYLYYSKIYGSHLFDTGWSYNNVFYNPETKRINSKYKKGFISLKKVSFGRMETFSGGGGDSWIYSNSIIYLDDQYTSLKEIYGKKPFLKAKIEELVAKFDETSKKVIKDVTIKIDEQYHKQVKSSAKVNEIEQEIIDLQNKLLAKESELRTEKMKIKNEVEDSISIESLDFTNRIVDYGQLKKYYKPNHSIEVDVRNIKSILKDIDKFEYNNPELFI